MPMVTVTDVHCSVLVARLHSPAVAPGHSVWTGERERGREGMKKSKEGGREERGREGREGMKERKEGGREERGRERGKG